MLPDRRRTQASRGDDPELASPFLEDVATASRTSCVAPDTIRRLVFDDEVVQSYANAPPGNSPDCAARVAEILRQFVPSVAYDLRRVLIWSSSVDRLPIDHLVVVARLKDHDWVIDPTASRFPPLAQTFKRTNEWIAALSAATPKNSIIKWLRTADANGNAGAVTRPAHAVKGELLHPSRLIWNE